MNFFWRKSISHLFLRNVQRNVHSVVATPSTPPLEVLSQAPRELLRRPVRIYQPCKSTMSSGIHGTQHWKLDWDACPDSQGYEHPVMGWRATGDVMHSTHLTFSSKEDAIRFAEKEGYPYFVQESTQRKVMPKAYAANFQYVTKTPKMIMTK